MSGSCFCFASIDAAERGIRQDFGEFKTILLPGLTCIPWPISTVATVSTKINPFNFDTQTKTFDNSTVSVRTSVQWQVDPERADKFYFTLTNPFEQMSAYVDDCVRGCVPQLTLDQAFESKTQLAEDIHKSISSSFSDFGVIIVRVLVTDVAADPNVMRAMNEINAAKRQREAAMDRAEADKILMVKHAEAEAESKYLQGVGTAKMRQAVAEGFKGSVENMKESTGMSPQEVVHMMLVTQYLDVLKDFAQSGKSAIVVPSGPGGVGDIEAQVRNGFFQAEQLGSGSVNTVNPLAQAMGK